MKDQMYDFTMHRTTMSERFEEADQIEFPTMTVCTQGGMKLSKLQKYGLQTTWHLLQNEFINKVNSTRFLVYQNRVEFLIKF